MPRNHARSGKWGAMLLYAAAAVSIVVGVATIVNGCKQTPPLETRKVLVHFAEEGKPLCDASVRFDLGSQVVPCETTAPHGEAGVNVPVNAIRLAGRVRRNGSWDAFAIDLARDRSLYSVDLPPRASPP